tara:strand:- start:952 stop:1587 length:636 start_codon:yes stop_codon:yes gene_type:complete
MDLRNMRLDYNKSVIDFDNLDSDPVVFFLKWFNDAIKINTIEANACVLSTVSADNKPSSRVVLLKDITDRGFTFFTNYKSKKSIHIENNNSVALNFFWPALERQVRITGKAEKVSSKESDNYFKSRPRFSKLGVLLSDQSSSIDLDYNFSKSLDDLEAKFKDQEIARPSYWGGYCITADTVEFWQGRPSRFHDRIVYEYNLGKWHITRLAP